MSELIQKSNNRATVKWQLLASVSALALIANAVTQAKAENSDRPTVWIELGGQLNRLNDGFEYFVPDFTSMRPANFSPSQKFEKPALYSLDEYGKIYFQPNDSGFAFSAIIRYGRSSVRRRVREQNPFEAAQSYSLYTSRSSSYRPLRQPRAARFAETDAGNSEQHLILDFQAGKDVGLGLFGKRGLSAVSLGVRFAQFTDKSNIALKSDPDWRFQPKTILFYGLYNLHVLPQAYHSNAGDFHATRSFKGIGPSVSWNGSEPLSGNAQEGELNIDWGVNAAVLFGRQKSRTQHMEAVRYNDGGNGYLLNLFYGRAGWGTMTTVYHHTPPAQTRSRSVVVPNIGGFAGLSFRYDTAKVSFGYRGDFFFGAMDGGIDEHKSYGRNFFGPYASISIGLGG